MIKSLRALGLSLLLSATALAAGAPGPVTVSLKGLVCTFCARGLDTTLRRQTNIERFEIHVATGEVQIWPKAGATPPTRTQLEGWVEKSGLGVKEIQGL